MLALFGCNSNDNYTDNNSMSDVPEPSFSKDQLINFTRYQTPHGINHYVDEFYTKSGTHCIESVRGLSCDFPHQP